MQLKLFTACAVLMLLLSTRLQAQSLLEQNKTYTRADTLRGGLRPERTCYDVHFYELNIRVDTANRSISGSNKIVFSAVTDFRTLQIDLYDNMKIISVTSGNNELHYRREYNAVFVDMPATVKAGTTGQITVHYQGKPVIAKRPPWDGGFTWTYDNNGKLWIGVSCEGKGASLWWPCKDHLSDEPDSMRIICNVPAGLQCVFNGNLEKVVPRADTVYNHVLEPNNLSGSDIITTDSSNTFYWKVSYPINNYNVSMNVGDYVHFNDVYVADDSSRLSLDYYVLSYNLYKAKLQFNQVKPMLKCYEKYLGKYPFWNDGYALVETPYLGMEHQSAIAYGNKYQTGYAGRDFSRIGLTFDYIIIHESAHEWWGNSVSCADIADMWIHEGFATYTEAIYVECMINYDTALKYINAKKSTVGNKANVVGIYGVNEEGDGDMYSKGMLFLNTLRHVINNDNVWWPLIKGMCDTAFKYKTTNYTGVVNYFNNQSGKNLSALFDQYLRHPHIPVLQYRLKKDGGKKYTLSYRWQTDQPAFAMPFYAVTDAGNKVAFNATGQWQSATVTLKRKDIFSIRTDLEYIDTEKQ
jgi:aminopeptidase N